MKIKVLPPHGCDRSCLDERGWMEVPEGTKVWDVLRMIRCNPLKAKILLVSRNGMRTTLHAELQDGDILGFLMPVSGG